jgi:predicted ATPase
VAAKIEGLPDAAKGSIKQFMFARCYVDNYRCFTSFTLPLAPLSVLLGANGSGKSAVIGLIAKLRDFILGREKSLDLFPPRTLTRWDKRIEQTFELTLTLDPGEYTYRLRIRHEAPERALNKVVEEKLTLDGRPLFASDDHLIRLYNDRHEQKAELLPDWHVSGISRVESRPENIKLMAFRRAIETTLVLALNPALVTAVSSEAQPVTFPRPDCSNFAGWLREVSSSDALARQEAEQALANGELPGFRLFQAVPSGDAKILECIFQGGPPPLKFRLDELSYGQIALIILETALAVAGQRGGVLVLDEPGNFLGLSEIQPLLTRLQDAALEGRFQVILTAHHPIAVDFLAAGYGSWLEREPSGPTRAHPVRIAEGISEDKAGVRVSDLIARGWLSGLGVQQSSDSSALAAEQAARASQAESDR